MDIDIYVKDLLCMCQWIDEIFVYYLGQSVEKVYQDLECDYILLVDEVVVYGLVDMVMECCF